MQHLHAHTHTYTHECTLTSQYDVGDRVVPTSIVLVLTGVEELLF